MDRAVTFRQDRTHADTLQLLDARLPLQDWTWRDAGSYGEDYHDAVELRTIPHGVVRVRLSVNDGTITLEEFDRAGVSLGELRFVGPAERHLDVLTLAVVVATNRARS